MGWDKLYNTNVFSEALAFYYCFCPFVNAKTFNIIYKKNETISKVIKNGFFSRFINYRMKSFVLFSFGRKTRNWIIRAFYGKLMGNMKKSFSFGNSPNSKMFIRKNEKVMEKVRVGIVTRYSLGIRIWF